MRRFGSLSIVLILTVLSALTACDTHDPNLEDENIQFYWSPDRQMVTVIFKNDTSIPDGQVKGRFSFNDKNSGAYISGLILQEPVAGRREFTGVITSIKGALATEAQLCEKIYFVGECTNNNPLTTCFTKNPWQPTTTHGQSIVEEAYYYCYQIGGSSITSCPVADDRFMLAKLWYGQVSGADHKTVVGEDFNRDYGPPDYTSFNFCGYTP